MNNFVTSYHSKKSTQNNGVNNVFFQPKLAINQPNDIYEQEADAMADKVMRMPDNESKQLSFFKPAISSLQRKCEHCEEEEKMQLKELSEEETTPGNELQNYEEMYKRIRFNLSPFRMAR